MSAMEPVGGSKPPEVNLADEFREFGRQLTSLLRVLRESPRAREIEQQLTQAVREMERQVNDALGTARERTQSQNLTGTIKGAAGTAADEAQRGLAHGLRTLNERMDKWVREAESRKPPAGGPGSGSGGEGGAPTASP